MSEKEISRIQILWDKQGSLLPMAQQIGPQAFPVRRNPSSLLKFETTLWTCYWEGVARPIF